MNPRLARMLTRFYPRCWRERYGEEFAAHLEAGPANLRTVANVIWGALSERALPTRGGVMNQSVPGFGNIISKPSALIPMGMSLIALTVVVSFLVANGVVHQPDEGAEAHIWQLLMAGQIPIVIFFAVKWLPRYPRQTLPVLAMQAGAFLASMAPVYFFHL
jgi:hypothetical protein